MNLNAVLDLITTEERRAELAERLFDKTLVVYPRDCGHPGDSLDDITDAVVYAFAHGYELHAASKFGHAVIDLVNIVKTIAAALEVSTVAASYIGADGSRYAVISCTREVLT
jgi:hypothetical protein